MCRVGSTWLNGFGGICGFRAWTGFDTCLPQVLKQPPSPRSSTQIPGWVWSSTGSSPFPGFSRSWRLRPGCRPECELGPQVQRRFCILLLLRKKLSTKGRDHICFWVKSADVKDSTSYCTIYRYSRKFKQTQDKIWLELVEKDTLIMPWLTRSLETEALALGSTHKEGNHTFIVCPGDQESKQPHWTALQTRQ